MRSLQKLYMTLSTNFFVKAFFIFFTGLICLAVLIPSGECELKPYVAVLPINNLSGKTAPLKEIRQSLIDIFKNQELNVLGEEALESFMAKHRLRYTGGIDKKTAEVFGQETGVKAVLITTLEFFEDTPPPKIALTSRLVSAGPNPEILWMDSVGIAGDDSPGILGLGLINSPKKLREKALQTLSKSLTGYLSDKSGAHYTGGKSRKKFRPKEFYRSPVMSHDMKYTLAVVPFFNISERKYAGDIMTTHFVRELNAFENFSVVEPGAVRETLLSLRIIMKDGISLADADIIFSSLHADLILTGLVLDYQDYQGTTGKPKVNFSVLVIDRKSREVVWTSKSYNEGDDGVYFFDIGKVNTAHAMASEMARNVVEMMIK